MKKRIISGSIFAALWVAVWLINSKVLDTIFIIAIAVVAMYEYLKAVRGIGCKPVTWIAYMGCFAIIFVGKMLPSAYNIMLIKIAIPLALIGAFSYILLTNVKRTMRDIAVTVLGLLYIPFTLAFLKLIMSLNNGRFYILFVLCGAFVSDTCAFLIGSKYGKRKLAPDISPNKTIEGALGGIAGVIIFFIVLAIIGKFKFGINVNIIYWIFVGIISAVSGQFGDLTASAIKRYCKIKDFGNIMPGHGGILDRVDSLMFVAPIVYIFIKLYI